MRKLTTKVKNLRCDVTRKAVIETYLCAWTRKTSQVLALLKPTFCTYKVHIKLDYIIFVLYRFDAFTRHCSHFTKLHSSCLPFLVIINNSTLNSCHWLRQFMLLCWCVEWFLRFSNKQSIALIELTTKESVLLYILQQKTSCTDLISHTNWVPYFLYVKVY